ncbi:MAG: EF-hand domain-containing protein [Novosphingobium sp.]
MKKSLIGFSALALGLAGAAYAADEMPGGDPLGDKTVTKAEFVAKGAAMFDKMDVNHDGKLDAADRAAHEGEMFDALDSDHNGSLSKAEFAAAHQRGPEGDGPGGKGMRHGGPGAEHGGHMGMMMMHMADTNQDGAVTRDEFAAAQAKHFDMIDANHDGQLTQAERKAAHDKMKAMGGGKHGGMRHGAMPMGDMPPPPPPAN